nr:hypothetical protein [Mesobacillus subterraneus]
MKHFAIVFLFLLVLAGCSQQNSDLEKSIYSIVEYPSNSQVDIGSLTDFEWDKAFLFPPYTSPEEMEEQLGRDFKDPSNIQSRDDIYLLVFVKDDKVVKYAEIDRQQADFSIGNKEYLTPDDSVFEIER